MVTPLFSKIIVYRYIIVKKTDLKVSYFVCICFLPDFEILKGLDQVAQPTISIGIDINAYDPNYSAPTCPLNHH